MGLFWKRIGKRLKWRQDMRQYKVAEIFTSINGEGQRAGQPAVFVRFHGCNLSCSFCDTMWANEPDAKTMLLTAEEIVQRVLETGIDNVTITGGEPLLQPGIEEILELLLRELRLSVEIETNGSVDISPFLTLPCGRRPLFTLDYKLAGSGMEKYMRTENYRLLTMQDTVKFVCSDREDLNRAKEIISQFGLIKQCRVYFSPVFGQIDPADMAAFLLEKKLNQATLQLQLHKIIWKPDRRGV